MLLMDNVESFNQRGFVLVVVVVHDEMIILIIPLLVVFEKQQ
jgi:Tfp pilus assembly protein PilX